MVFSRRKTIRRFVWRIPVSEMQSAVYLKYGKQAECV